MSGYVDDVLWSVEERSWKQDQPSLSDDVISLIAAPVVVTASTWSATRPPVPVVRVMAPAPPRRDRVRTMPHHLPRTVARTA